MVFPGIGIVTPKYAGDIPEDQPLEQMRIVFLTGALFNMVCMWLDTGMRQTPEQMADIFAAFYIFLSQYTL